MVGVVSLSYLINPYQLYWPNQPKNCPIEIFQNAKNLTLVVDISFVLRDINLIFCRYLYYVITLYSGSLF